MLELQNNIYRVVPNFALFIFFNDLKKKKQFQNFKIERNLNPTTVNNKIFINILKLGFCYTSRD